MATASCLLIDLTIQSWRDWHTQFVLIPYMTTGAVEEAEKQMLVDQVAALLLTLKSCLLDCAKAGLQSGRYMGTHPNFILELVWNPERGLTGCAYLDQILPLHRYTVVHFGTEHTSSSVSKGGINA